MLLLGTVVTFPIFPIPQPVGRKPSKLHEVRPRLVFSVAEITLDALKVCKEKGITVSVTNVIAVGINDTPGAFSVPMQILADADIDVEYMYAFITRKSEKAYVILRVADNNEAAKVLADNGVELLSEDEFHKMM